MSETAAIVLAAGKSTRMQSDLPKVLHEICGRPMLSYVLSACCLAGADRLIVVVGHEKEKIRRRFKDQPEVQWVEQVAQRGTGDAVRCCRDLLRGFSGNVLVIAGDMPLVRRETLARLIEVRENRGDALTIATTMLDDPTGYGRIIRDSEGRLEAIVEQADCSAKQQEIQEVNPSYYCFDAERLFEVLERIAPSGTKEEYYLTDVVELLRDSGHRISASTMVDCEDARGINTRLDLAVVGRVMQDRIQLSLINDGVTIVDPDNTWIESDVSIGQETIVHPFTVIEAGAIVGQGCRLGPFARVSPGARIEDGATVGPVTQNGAGM